MTNHEKLAKITGEYEPVEIEALKMTLERIYEDFERECFEDNYENDRYLMLYESYVEWLSSEIG